MVVLPEWAANQVANAEPVRSPVPEPVEVHQPASAPAVANPVLDVAGVDAGSRVA